MREGRAQVKTDETKVVPMFGDGCCVERREYQRVRWGGIKVVGNAVDAVVCGDGREVGVWV